MKAFAITLSSLVALLAGKTLAAPAAGADVQKRFDASFSLYSPDDSSYFLSVPTDHQSHPIGRYIYLPGFYPLEIRPYTNAFSSFI